MKKISIFVLLACLLFPTQSFAKDQMGIYISPKLSWMFSNSDLNFKATTGGCRSQYFY